MKRVVCLFFLALLCLCCSTAPSPQAPISQTPGWSIPTLQAYTVLLEHPSMFDPDVMSMHCSGVWVAPDKILTAGHCGRAFAEAFYAAFPGDKPRTYVLAREDFSHDLALLKASDPPAHPVVRLAPNSPAIGEVVHMMGHPGGLEWTYYLGYVAGYRDNDFGLFLGSKLQIQAPVFGGMSGSGAYNDAGQLVGLASFTGRAPGVGFYTHLTSIRNFLLAP